MLNLAAKRKVYGANHTTPSKLKRVKLLSLNTRMGLGSDNHYVFELGPDKIRFDDYYAVCAGFEKLMLEFQPDIICLQEVLARIYLMQFMPIPTLFLGCNQRKQIASLIKNRFNLNHHSYHPYIDKWFIPHYKAPCSLRVELFSASRYPYNDAYRFHLCKELDINPFSRYFFPRRSILGISFLPENNLVVYNTHLSPFSQGKLTLKNQITFIYELLSYHQARNENAIILGDFNTDLPEIDLLYHNFTPFPPLHVRDDPVAKDAYINTRTSVSTSFNRIFNYAFMTRGIKPISMHTVQKYKISDHFPILIEIEI